MGELNNYVFNFNSFRLIDVHFTINSEVASKLEKGANIQIAPEIGVGYQLLDNKKVITFLEVQMIKDLAPFSFSIKGQGEFEFLNEVSQGKELERIAYINLASIIYPFVRESIADLTRRLGFTPLLMAPINFVEFYNSSAKQLEPENKAV